MLSRWESGRGFPEHHLVLGATGQPAETEIGEDQGQDLREGTGMTTAAEGNGPLHGNVIVISGGE